jgi:hypothetical protein
VTELAFQISNVVLMFVRSHAPVDGTQHQPIAQLSTCVSARPNYIYSLMLSVPLNSPHHSRVYTAARVLQREHAVTALHRARALARPRCYDALHRTRPTVVLSLSTML